MFNNPIYTYSHNIYQSYFIIVFTLKSIYLIDEDDISRYRLAYWDSFALNKKVTESISFKKDSQSILVR